MTVSAAKERTRKIEKVEVDELDLKTIELSDTSGDVKISPYATNVQLGPKSTELEAIRKDADEKARQQLLLQDPYLSSREFMQRMLEMRKQKEREAAEAALQFDLKREAQLKERRQKERAAATQRILDNESAFDKEKRLEREYQVGIDRKKAIATIENRYRREQEALEVWFNLSDRRYASYSNSKHLLDDSPVKRCISSRVFGSSSYGQKRYAFRCNIDHCRYTAEERLSLSAVEDHIRATSDHQAYITKLIEAECLAKINELKALHKREDSDPEFMIQTLDKQINAAEKMKVRNANNFAGYVKQNDKTEDTAKHDKAKERNRLVDEGLADPYSKTREEE
jgi:hypothetical protein